MPGGLVEANEAPCAAAVREIEEELALRVPIGRLLVVDWVPPGLGPGDGVMFVYDGGMLDAEQTAGITLPEAELRSWAWCDDRAVAERLPGCSLAGWTPLFELGVMAQRPIWRTVLPRCDRESVVGVVGCAAEGEG